MIGSGASSRHMLGVDLTPMIDVVLQLIIFFMLTSSFGDMRRTPVDLPREAGESAAARGEPALIVDLDAQGRLLVDSREISLVELERIARAGVSGAAQPTDFDVLIRPDRMATARDLDLLLERLARTGVTRWKLATTEPDGPGGVLP
ncbi:MAG: biopolymer transporter ExbD [Phycisphaerales bacterium]|nr:biopolymer transporter ExbD [Planctomycetota bacterium]MCH8507866.1 biopolymer transporter ExbD [Phycisphaerales bacterium]